MQNLIKNKRGMVGMAVNLISLIIGVVIALTAFALLLPTFVNATTSVAATGVTGSGLFSSLLPFILVLFIFVAVITLLVKMVKSGKGGHKY
jgi:phosphate starvation-inducible membrane PsiE